MYFHIQYQLKAHCDIDKQQIINFVKRNSIILSSQHYYPLPHLSIYNITIIFFFFNRLDISVSVKITGTLDSFGCQFPSLVHSPLRVFN